MKKWKYFVMLFAALALLAVPAYAEEMEAENAEPVEAVETEDVGPAEDVSAETEPGETTEEEVPAEPEDMPEAVELEAEGTADLFQCGSLTGAYTMPGEVSLFADDADYQLIYEGLKARKASFTLVMTASGDFQSRIKTCYDKVVNDHPELFYVTGGYGISYYTNGTITLKPSYRSVTDDEINRFNAKVVEIVGAARKFSDSLEQMLYVHDYLVLNCAYNWEVSHGQSAPTDNVYSAYGVLIEGDAVCQGYALAYKVILNQLGINCVLVSSSAMNHAWNLVQLNGNWYHVDVTWDDPVDDVQGRVMHNYFLLTDATIKDGSHNHKGWSTSVTCTDQKYESGYIFSTPGENQEGVKHPIYFWNNQYYYVSFYYYNNCSLYSSSSIESTGATKISNALGYNTADGRYGMVWLDGTLLYVGYADNKIYQYDLQTGKTKTIGTVPATSSGSIGLRYDNDKIVASSSSPRGDLASFEIPKYPAEWDNIKTTQILGRADSKTVGFYCETPKSTFWVAYYQNGKFIKAEVHQFDKEGLHLVELGTPPAGYTGMRLILTNASYTPECAAFPVEK